MQQQVTINDARLAVVQALVAAFPGIPVTGEELPSPPYPPRLHVSLTEPTHAQELGRRYRREYPFVIRYFGSQRTNEDDYAMAERLTVALGKIEVAGVSVFGTGMRMKITEEALDFFVRYSLLVWEPQPEVPDMRTIEIKEVKPT